MMPGQYPLTLYRGDSAQWRVVMWLDSQRTQPFDLTGITAKAEIREAPGGVLITPTTCTVTLPNIIDIVLEATDSETVVPVGVWDLQLTYPDGKRATILAGPVTATPDVTDSVAVPVTTPQATTLTVVPKRGAGRAA